MSKPLTVLHIIDTLEVGGQERVVINLVNHLPRERCRTFLCTTRRDGPLLEKLMPHVMRFPLRRRHRFDVQAIKKLICIIREQDIQILHAHGPSLFLAILASLFSPFPAVIWHVHSGRLATGVGITWPYRLVAKRIDGIIAVNQALADWSCRILHLSSKKVWYLPNFIWSENIVEKKTIDLPGQIGGRVVCLANLHSPKDHATLLLAMALVIQKVSHAHLILVGSTSDTEYLEQIKRLMATHQLEKSVSFLGHRDDVMDILESCDIGVLSSTSEGFPMTLLEYGMARLPTVATQVGQCPEVLDYGRAGLLVPPRSPTQLAEAIMELLLSPARREHLGEYFGHHVQEKFNQHQTLEKFCQFYEKTLEEPKEALTVPIQ